MEQQEFNEMLAVAIAGGLGGGTYISRWDGEEIDAAIQKLLVPGGILTPNLADGAVTWSKLAAEARPNRDNLIDNCDFAIWQRYPDGVYTGVPDRVYIPDRFKITSSNGALISKIVRAEGGGIYNQEGPNCFLTYQMEDAAVYNGMIMTLSLLLKNDSGDKSLVTRTKVASGWTSQTNILNFFDPMSSLSWVLSGHTNIRYKLEVGPNQTLAHQDADGNWVLNDPPPRYGEELAECRRYYRRYGAGITAHAQFGNLIVCFPFDWPLRENATPKLLNRAPHFFRAGSSLVVNDATIASFNVTRNGIVFIGIAGTMSTPISDNNWYRYNENTDLFELSAEL